MIYGNIEGIKNSLLEKLEKLYDINIYKDELFTEEISTIICDITNKINREISIAIDRKGKIINIAIGDSSTVEMPVIDINEKTFRHKNNTYSSQWKFKTFSFRFISSFKT